MATERLSMRHTREILRQKWLLRRPHREVARSLRVGLGTITSMVHRAAAAGLDWVQIQALAGDALQARLYGARRVAEADRPFRTARTFTPSGASPA